METFAIKITCVDGKTHHWPDQTMETANGLCEAIVNKQGYVMSGGNLGTVIYAPKSIARAGFLPPKKKESSEKPV